MKTIITTIAVSVLLLSCSMKSDSLFPLNLSVKEGKGIIKTNQYEMNIDEIKVAQSISAEVVKSDTEKVVITAPSDIMDEILVDNVDGKLFIHFKPNRNISARNIAAKVFVRDFTHLEATSAAKILVKDKFTQDKTDVEVSSSGRITGNLEANDFSVDVSSSGYFSGEIWAVNLDAEATSSGDINLSGKAKNAALKASSAGTVDAGKLTAEISDIQASSAGNVTVATTNQLNASASSGGNIAVYRKGNLHIVSQNESSGGSVSIK